jgi:hypothetical protein
MLVDVLDRIRDGADFLSRIVWDFDTKLFFKGHYKLNDIKRIGAQIVNEAGVFGDLVSLDPEVLDFLTRSAVSLMDGSLRERQMKIGWLWP